MRRPTISTAQVQADYRKVKALLPTVGELHRDDAKRWWINRLLIGETAREASQYLRGLHAGLVYAVWAAKAS